MEPSIPDFIELAGSVHVPEELRDLSWEEIRERAWKARGEELEVLSRTETSKQDRTRDFPSPSN